MEGPRLIRKAGRQESILPAFLLSLLIIFLCALCDSVVRNSFVAKYFATCARGLEPLLADELRDLGADRIEPGRGGVQFQGDLATLYRANLWLRTAVRVLWPILEEPVTSPD